MTRDLAERGHGLQNKEWYGRLMESAFARTVRASLHSAGTQRVVASVKANVRVRMRTCL